MGPQGATGAQGPVGVATANAPLSLAGTTLSIDLAAYAPLASPTFTGDPKAPTPTVGDNDTSVATTAFVQTAVVNNTGITPQGRLTLASATPVMTSTVSGATTIYYSLYAGNKVPIYDGSNLVTTTFAELSVAITDTTKSPAAIGVSKVNDWFVWNDAGTIRLGHGPDRTSDTARSAGTALVRVNGIWLNNASITNGRRRSAALTGTTRSSSSSTLQFLFPVVGIGSGAGFFGVWNAYNRVDVGGFGAESTASWTYNSTTPRNRNANNNSTIYFVCGLNEDVASMNISQYVQATGTADPLIGIGVDTSSAFTSVSPEFNFGTSIISLTCSHRSLPGIGNHIWNALEACNTANPLTFYGATAGPPARERSSFNFSFRM
jgi:hypothetical protein